MRAVLFILLLPLVTAYNLRRKLESSLLSNANVNTALQGKIIGVDMLIQDLFELPRDSNDPVRFDWVTKMVGKIEREFELLPTDSFVRKDMGDAIIDLKNDLMRAKETMIVSLEEDQNEIKPFQDIRKILDKADFLKEGITDLSNELMTLRQDVLKTHRSEEDMLTLLKAEVQLNNQISFLQSRESIVDLSNEKLMNKVTIENFDASKSEDSAESGESDASDATIEDASANRSISEEQSKIMASLLEFGVTEAEVANHYGVSETDVHEKLDALRARASVAFEEEEEAESKAYNMKYQLLETVGFEEDEIKEMLNDDRENERDIFDP